METTEILDSIERDAIEAFASNKIQFEAVKKYLLAYVYVQGVNRPGLPSQGNVNWALQLAWNRDPKVTDADLGADLRAVARGIQVVESGFAELLQIKKPEVVKEEEPQHI